MCHCDGLRFLCDLPEKRFRVLPDSMAAGGVDHAVARCVQQPRLRFLRDAVRRPSLQRCRDCVTKRVFRAGDIARARRDVGDEPAIRIARDGFNRSMRRGFAPEEGLLPPTARCDPNNGRTSTEAYAAAG